MSIEEIRKITCDGCGVARTFVIGKDKRDEHPPWYRILPDVAFCVFGQSIRPPRDQAIDASNYAIDACSAECALKAYAKHLPALPDRLPTAPS